MKIEDICPPGASRFADVNVGECFIFADSEFKWHLYMKIEETLRVADNAVDLENGKTYTFCDGTEVYLKEDAHIEFY